MKICSSIYNSSILYIFASNPQYHVTFQVFHHSWKLAGSSRLHVIAATFFFCSDELLFSRQCSIMNDRNNTFAILCSRRRTPLFRDTEEISLREKSMTGGTSGMRWSICFLAPSRKISSFFWRVRFLRPVSSSLSQPPHL